MGAFCCKRPINVPPTDFPKDLNTIVVKYLYGDFFVSAIQSLHKEGFAALIKEEHMQCRQNRERYVNWLYTFYRGSAVVHGIFSTDYGWYVYRNEEWWEQTFVELSNIEKIRTLYPGFSLEPGTVSRLYLDKTFASVQTFLAAKIPEFKIYWNQ
jgi:hypothetical protein